MRQVLAMKYSGYDNEDISHALSLSLSQVQNIIDRAIKVQADEFRATYVREAELDKLDNLEAVYLDAAAEGDHRSAYLVLKMMERRSAILGIDRSPPPASVNVNLNLVNILSSMNPHVPIPPSQVIEHDHSVG